MPRSHSARDARPDLDLEDLNDACYSLEASTDLDAHMALLAARLTLRRAELPFTLGELVNDPWAG